MEKVCIITHSYPRFEGDWRSNFIESLAHAYADNDVEVTVLVPFSPRFDRPLTGGGKVRIVTYAYAPFRSWHTIGYGHSVRSDLAIDLQDLLLMPFLLFFGVIRFAKLLREEKFAMVHAHWAVPNTVIAVLGRWLARTPTKIFTSFPGTDVTVLAKLGWARSILRRIIMRSDYLSCNSSDLRESLVSSGFNGNGIDLVIYGVDDKNVSFSEAKRTELRRAWGVSDKDIVLLMIGRFVPKKGFSTALRAIKYITGKRSSITMVVVGDGPLKDEYLRIVREDRTEPFVRFIGEISVQELSGYYSASDIFLMPSRKLPADGLNVVVPEAMACARPVIASNIGGNELVVFPGVNGFLHAEDDHLQLAELVIELANDPELRGEMGRNALQLVKERFCWDVIAKQYLAAYHDRAR